MTWLHDLSGRLQDADVHSCFGHALAFADVAVQLHWGDVSSAPKRCGDLLGNSALSQEAQPPLHMDACNR
jgi:hypothetical protein